MARRKQTAPTSTDASDPNILAAWETLCWISEHYYNFTKVIHTFAPRQFVKAGLWVVTPADDKKAIDEAIWRGLWSRRILLQRSSDIMVALNKHLIAHQSQPDPTPSSPRNPPKINLTIKHDDGRQYIWGWREYYAARRIVDLCIMDRATKWLDDNTLRIADKVTITTDHKPDGLSVIMEHEFNERELAWQIGHDQLRACVGLFMNYEQPKPYGADDAARDTAEAKPKTPKAVKTEKPKVEKPSGLTSLPDLLSDTDITPKEARTALRKLNTPKPAHGRWEWPAAEAKALKPTIVAAVKKARK
jgi:hypothetical protein